MKQIRILVIAGSLIVSISMVATAVVLLSLGDGARWEIMTFITLLLVFSPIPALSSFVLLKAIGNYTKEIELFSTRDPLTRLYNQIAFWDMLEYETERSKRQGYRFSLLTIDVDNFKAVNDTYGHEVGDTFLKDFSSIFKSAVRKGDIAARFAGDKFMAILPVCDEAQAYIVAKRIIEGLRDFSLTIDNGTRITGSVSIGVAVYPDHAATAKDLYLLSDNMMVRAKASGKDRLSLPSEGDNVELLRSAGETSILIMDAIKQRRIIPYFQAIMNVENNRIEAYEVLTRIILPERVIAAADFIEAAEGMGAIGKIDYQLIELAFEQVRAKQYTGNLFLNLSPKALVLNEFMPTVRKLMRDYNLDPTKMVFEITERDTVKNVGLIDKFIRDLKKEGFRFAIDDFGAGYSSFQYIKSFSVDFLKIDGEFIRSMGDKSGIEKEIVKSIAILATKLGIKTIAEYVETDAILDEVKSAGIQFAQGYFIQHPSPDLGP